MDVLEGLNEAQRRAATAGGGAMLIVAGPGTGKTKTLAARIAYLLEEQKVRPGEIVALTFTNKAAREMRERLSLILPNKSLPKICTFHALGADLLKQNGKVQKLVSEAERLEIIREIKKPAAFKSLSLRELSLLISRVKTSLEKPADPSMCQLVENYEGLLIGQNLHDYDDLLCKSFDLLKTGENKRPHYKYVLVDEFQDTSELQYELLKLLGARQNIFAIGDPNQAIYGWRGAGAEMFGNFQKDFPQVQKIDLTINYRSRPEIVRLANAIFPNSPQLISFSKTNGLARAMQTLNEYSEAAYVMNEIEKSIGGSDFLKASEGDGRQPRDYAVLYRSHRAGRTLQKLFSESGMPFQIAGEGSPYEKSEIQTIIAELHDHENSAKLAVCDLAKQLAEAKHFETESLQWFFNSLVQFGTDVEAALNHIDQIAEQEFYDPSVNAVTLMTIHASKGLEFPHVLLISVEENILPKTKSEDIDEERRLFYVAATRAKENLEIIHTKFRAGEPAQTSCFIDEIAADILTRAVDPNMNPLEKRQRKRAQKRAQTSLF